MWGGRWMNIQDVHNVCGDPSTQIKLNHFLVELNLVLKGNEVGYDVI